MTHTINVPLLRKGLEHITGNPLEWDQHSWYGYDKYSPCKTAGCLAGHVAVFSGVPLAYQTYEGVDIPVSSTDLRSLAGIARTELGLSLAEADALFDGNNKLEDMWAMAERFTDGDIQACEMDALV